MQPLCVVEDVVEQQFVDDDEQQQQLLLSKLIKGYDENILEFPLFTGKQTVHGTQPPLFDVDGDDITGPL
uniref:Neurotransmitter-gated ion-channel ligand-binding domain-containing protein n=1 Tax=Syphacia muris TaxID=451379 RepID=A0A0N5AUW1_9BILA